MSFKKLLLIFITVISFHFSFSQSPSVKQWDKRFGGTDNETITCFLQTSDGGYILGGYSLSDIGGDKTQPLWSIAVDYWIVKTDSLGNFMWDRDFGGTNDDILISMQETDDGGFILGGISNSNTGGDKTQPNLGGSDYWIIKTDANGNKQWDKNFGGTDEDALTFLQQTADGGFILGGYSRSPIGGDKTQPTVGASDYWIVKTDSFGSKEWDKDFGGSNNDYFTCLQQTLDGGYILGGYSNSGISGDKSQASWGGYDYWIVKTDSLGMIQWDVDFGGSGDDSFFSLLQTDDGGYVLAGTSQSGISGNKALPLWGGVFSDYWIIKTNELGIKSWEKNFGGTSYEELSKVASTNDGGFLISGDSYSAISGDKTENNLGTEQTWAIKTDSLGNKQWDKTMLTSGHDETGMAIQTIDGCFAFANYSNGGINGYKTQANWDSTGASYDYWLVKFCDTSQIGVAVPVINLASSDTSFCEKQCIDFFDLSTNNPTSWLWFFPGADSTFSTLQNPTNICYNTYGSFDVTLIACNAAGCDTLVMQNFISEFQNPVAVIVQSNDTLYASGGITYQWFDVNSGIINGATDNFFVSNTAGNYFVVVTDSNGCESSSNVISITTGLNITMATNDAVTIAPNPFTNEITITFLNQNTRQFSVCIKNTLGQNVFIISQQLIANSQQLNLNFLENGIYFLEIASDDFRSIHKIVKQ